MEVYTVTKNEVIKNLEDFHQRILATKLAEKITEGEMISILSAIDIITRQQEEIERMKGWENLLKAEKHSLIKSEAIKEFANKIKNHKQRMFSSDWSGEYQDDAVRVEIIDNIVKEMVGEENDR